MKKILLLLLCLGLCGCATISEVTAKNRENLFRLSIGMSKEEVINIMGTGRMSAYYSKSDFKSQMVGIAITNPYRSEILQGKDKTFEVIYYVTDDKNNDGAISDDELTPLVFDNGKLIGWGWSFLKDNVEKYEIRLR